MHEKYTFLMSLHLDGETTAEERLALHEHLQHCPGCAILWRDWVDTDRLMRTQPLAAAPAGFPARVALRLDVQASGRRQRAQLAGVLALCAVIGAGVALSLSGITASWGLRNPREVALVISAATQLWRGFGDLVATVGSVLPASLPGALVLAALMSIVASTGLGLLWASYVQYSRRWLTPHSV
jgi:anti-sigma factor RsiW